MVTSNKGQFLGELNTHIKTLDGFLGEVSGEVKDLKGTLQTLESARGQELNSLATSLLPNLSPKTMSSVVFSRLFAILTLDDVERLRQTETARIRALMGRVAEIYNPATYDTKRAELQIEISSRSDAATQANNIFDNVPDLARLVRSGYGTGQYGLGWFDFQMYSDWKRADEIVDSLKMKNWEEVRNFSEQMLSEKRTSESLVVSAREALANLDSAKTSHEKLDYELSQVDSVILEKLQTKIRATLDAASGEDLGGKEFGNLCRISKKITAAQAELSSKQSEKQSLTAEIGKLRNLYTVAEKSRQTTIPAQYLQVAPSAGYRRGAFYSRGGGSYNGGNSNNDLLTYMFYDQLFHHFDSRDSRSSTTVYVEREQPRREVINEDRYGRVS